MIEKLFGKISGIFDSNKNEDHSKKIEAPKRDEAEADQLDPSIKIIDFVREIERYYREYIFHTRSKYINGNLSDEEAMVFKRRMEQYEAVLNQIICIRTKLVELERNNNTFGTESYSFGGLIQKDSLEQLHINSFEIAKQINSINVIPILDKIIADQLEIYRKTCNIQGSEIPKNTSLRIIEVKDNAEFYQFGNFEKALVISDTQALLPEQVKAINNLKITLSLKTPPANQLLIRCTTITRRQLDFLKKSTIFKNDWEVGSSEDIYFDIVNSEDLDYYIKSLLQLLLNKKDFVMITVINPANEFSQVLQNMLQVDVQNQKVKVIDKMAFWLAERNDLFKDNLQFQFISRKDKMKQINFQTYREFIKKFLIV